MEKRIFAYLIGAAAIAGGAVLVINGLSKKTYKDSKKKRGKLLKNAIAGVEKMAATATKKSLARRTTVKDTHDKYANQ